jgi:hypothetical protein
MAGGLGREQIHLFFTAHAFNLEELLYCGSDR